MRGLSKLWATPNSKGRTIQGIKVRERQTRNPKACRCVRFFIERTVLEELVFGEPYFLAPSDFELGGIGVRV